ncbi:GNAT family N-acetyltransferase [Streptomyces sp. NPDC058664]
MAPYRPEEPGWFLETVATAPEAQGKGLGSAVLIPGIQEAERAGYPAFLEPPARQTYGSTNALASRSPPMSTSPTTAPARGACAGLLADSLRIRPAGAGLRPPLRPLRARPRPDRVAGAERRWPERER